MPLSSVRRQSRGIGNGLARQSAARRAGGRVLNMKRRKGIIALIAATAGLGVAAIPAAAELHSVTVVLVTGERIQVQVDVPAGHAGQPGPDPRHHRHDHAGHRQRPGHGADADRDPGPPTVRAPQPPTSTPTPDGNDAAGRAQPHPGRRRAATVPRAHVRARATRPSAPATSTPRRSPGARSSARPARRPARPSRSAAARSAARRRSTTRPSRWRCRAPLRSACRTSSSTSSASRRSSSRSTRPPASSTACAGRSSRRSTRSRPTTAATSTSPPPARSAGCSSCPRTWEQYGVDANKDDLKDPYNPADAIFAAARYLKAAGAEQDLRKAIFAYNHADWYVDSVLMRARLIGGLPSNFVGSLTGLTQGHFPVAAKATYADDLSEQRRQEAVEALAQGGQPCTRGRGFQAPPRDQGLRPPRRARGRRQRRQGRPRRREQAPRPLRPVPGRLRQHLHVRAPGQGRQDLPRAPPAHDDAQGRRRASSRCPPRTPSRPRPRPPPRCARASAPSARSQPAAASASAAARVAPTKQRLFAHPDRPKAGRAGGDQQLFERTGKIDGGSTFKAYLTQGLRPQPQGRPDQEAAPGLADRGRHDARPHRPDLEHAGAAHAVRDPPGRPRRPAHRPEADPRRLEAARVDRDLPRRRQEPVLRPGRARPRRSARSC